MENFTPMSAAVGGLLIGLSVGLLWLFNGRLAGISGIFGGWSGRGGDTAWRAAFLGFLIAGAAVGFAVLPAMFEGFERAPPTVEMGAAMSIIAGALVGIGTRLGGGCTSGHGICGLARFSRRSAVAVAVFMTTAVAVVFVQRHVLG